MKVNYLKLFFPKAYDIVIIRNGRSSGFPRSTAAFPYRAYTGTVAVVAVNMKGLQLRVQLRNSGLNDRSPDSLISCSGTISTQK